MIASVKENPFAARDFADTVQNSAHDSQNFLRRFIRSPINECWKRKDSAVDATT
jgi:hypothetical protein